MQEGEVNLFILKILHVSVITDLYSGPQPGLIC